MADAGRQPDKPQNASPESTPEADSPKTRRQAPRVTPAVRPGPIARLWQTCCAPFSRIKLPQWNLRNFAWILLGLLVIVLLASNWSPMRFYFFGLWLEVPKALSVLVLLGAGFLVGWFTRNPKRPEQESQNAPQEEAKGDQ